MNFLTIILALIILIFSFTEILVFNEEVLLALCFIAFVFFAYSKLNNTISSFFKDNALKLENELLYSLVLKSEKIIIQFNDSYHSRKLQNSNLLLESLALFSISSFINNFFSNFINISLGKIHNSFKDTHCFCLGSTTAKAVRKFTPKLTIAKTPDELQLFYSITKYFNQ